MSLSLHVRKALLCYSLALGVPGLVCAQGTFLTNGVEYPIAASRPGDQVHPDIAFGPNGGYIVWEDNVTSSSGLAISAQRLDSSVSADLSSFQVNSSTIGDHERARVSLLNDGGAVFVWQGGRYGYQHIYARFLSASNTFTTGDIMVNSSTNFSQIDPAIATLNNGNVVVVWSSFNQYSTSSMRDVYAQVFSPAGQKIGGEFLVNQFTAYNQRTPAITALSTGGFVVVWVSEQQQRVGADSSQQLVLTTGLVHSSVDIYARRFNDSGQAVASEVLVNTGTEVCANPTIAGSSNGGFIVGWSQKDSVVPSNSWDVFARVFSGSGTGGAANLVNTETYGDQYGPRASSAGSDYLVVWTSLGQDSSMEGVYGQFLHSDGSTNGSEFRVSTTWVNKQMHPAVGSDGAGHFAVAWTSFTGSRSSFDLFAQRYVNSAQPLPGMAAPFVYVPFVTINGIYQPTIVVSWPAQVGLAVDHYNLYVDGTSIPLGTNVWTMTVANGLTASSTHTFQVEAVGSDTLKTPISSAATATTWSGYSWGGIPFEWMAGYYGMDSSQWPPANNPLGAGAPTLYQIYLTGANPTNPSSWLHTSLEVTQVQGQTIYLLHWNPQPGLVYQVQSSSDMVNWTDFQSPRLAADIVDSVAVPKGEVQYYRLVRLR